MASYISSALACDDRPGTPTDIRTEAGIGSLTVHWRDTTRPGEGSCHDIEILRTRAGDNRSVTGDVCLSGGTQGSYTVKNLVFGEQYCIRLKARDRAGTQGCVSAQWSATVCDSALPPSGPGVGRISEFMRDTDLPGSDIESANGRVVFLTVAGRTPNIDRLGQDCQKLCNRHGRCVAWTLVKPGVQGPHAVCYLKHQIPAPVQAGCCVSGNRVLVNTDLPGMDIDRIPLSSPQPADCEKKCADNRRCATWTYVKPGVQQASAVCYLKGSIPDARANGCCTSGRIR
jgi:hypothetical protein